MILSPTHSPPTSTQLNSNPMPCEAVLETAVDALGAQLSYDGSRLPPEWARLRPLSSSPHYHSPSLALLCAVWHVLGFPQPLRSLQSSTAHGWSVAAQMAASHAPTSAVFQLLCAS